MDFSIVGPVSHGVRYVSGKARLELLPEQIVGPFLDIVVERALDIVAAQPLAALGGQGEAALAIGVDDVRKGAGLRHDAEPAEGIALVVGLQHRSRDAAPANPVKPVAADHIVAIDLFGVAVLVERDEGGVRREVVKRDVGRLVDNDPVRRVAGRIEILGDRCLAVGQHLLAGIFGGIDQDFPLRPSRRYRRRHGDGPPRPSACPARHPAAARRTRLPGRRRECAAARARANVSRGRCCGCPRDGEYATASAPPGPPPMMAICVRHQSPNSSKRPVPPVVGVSLRVGFERVVKNLASRPGERPLGFTRDRARAFRQRSVRNAG